MPLRKKFISWRKTSIDFNRGGMVDFPDSAGWGVLRFFGRISASISHELKNSLSIVNENAGLLEDLALLAEKSGRLDIDRVKSLSSSIGRQVKRTDQIIRNMNKFSHSVDLELKSIDLREYLELIAAVSGRLLSVRSTTLNLSFTSDRTNVTTCPIFFLYLLWHLIDCCSRWSEPGKTLDVSLGRSGNLISIEFNGCKAVDPEFQAEVMGRDLKILLAFLKCSLDMDAHKIGMKLSFTTNPAWED
jgi:light-regulated signal transduction histidine kinase (bacteriophytochrome)